MKKVVFLYIIVVFLFHIKIKAQTYSNCSEAFTLCYDSVGYQNFNRKGFGVQEISSPNSCSSEEHNSMWIKVTFRTSGTFGFDLKPYNNYGQLSQFANVDYDFFVFGPNATCGNLGSAIRCSTTNSKDANLPDTYTGMNGSETDTSEGPGASGNSFVKWIDVNAGETYYIAIDVKELAAIETAFNFIYTGSALREGTPVSEVPAGTSLDMAQCDDDGVFDYSTTFDLTKNSPIIIGSQTNVTVSYYLNMSDAINRLNVINNPSAFVNTLNPQLIVALIEHNNTSCSAVESFYIKVVDSNVNYVATKSAVCDDMVDGDDNNGKAVFDLNKVTSDILGNLNTSNLTIKYYLTQNEAIADINPLTQFFYNSISSKQSIFVTVTGANYCSKRPQEIQLIVNPLPPKNTYSLTQCDVGSSPDGLTLFNLSEADKALTQNDVNLSVKYFLNVAEELNSNSLNISYLNITNPQQIIARITDARTGCSSLGFLNLRVNVIAENTLIIKQCDVLGQENGFATFNLNDANITLSPTQTIKYYLLQNEALLEKNEIINNTNYTNSIAYKSAVFARIEDDNACYGIVEIQLIVNKLPKIITEGKDFLCSNISNDFVSINAAILEGNPTDYTYKWERNGQILSEINYGIQVNQTGIYTVEVTNSDNCSKFRKINVEQSSSAATVDIDVTDVTTNSNTVTVIVTGLGEYSYSLDEPFGPFQSLNFFENVSAGIHEVYILDENGCGTINETIAVIGIPKFFTPNNDGFNDVWKIKGVDAVFNTTTNVIIFDRYGKYIKQIPIGDFNGWDGTLNGKSLPADDYWYNINLADGRIVKGHFALKR